MEKKDKLIDIDSLVYDRKPELIKKIPANIRKSVFDFLERLLCLDNINDLMHRFRELQGIDFIEAFFSDIDFEIKVQENHLENIPRSGRFIGISNHPLGGLDGLALLKVVSEVRGDVKFLVNDVLSWVTNLKNVFIPYSRKSLAAQARSARNMVSVMKKEGGILLFPAGGVSRVRHDGIRDPRWMEGAFHLAQRFKCPIVPMFVRAKNSLFYYLCTILHRNLAALMLPREIFNKRRQRLEIKVGEPVPYELIEGVSTEELAKVFKKEIYRFGMSSEEMKIDLKIK